jgi:hypothetical protein
MIATFDRSFERSAKCSTKVNSMALLSDDHRAIFGNVGAPALLTFALLFSAATLGADDATTTLLLCDKAFVQSFAQKDAAAADKLLAADFAWINSRGERWTRAEALEAFPSVANADVNAEVRLYGTTAVIRANKGKANVLRVWVKGQDAWKVLLYQEVTQVEKSEPAAGDGSGQCLNPCKQIPFQPATIAEKEAVASWQGVMKAMAENDAAAYAPLIADEFTATDTHHDRPYTKADRLVQIQKQKVSGKHNSPPELLSAEMFDLGETVLMIAREHRPGAKAYFNSRMWVKREARWQMLFSFNTRIE